MMTKQQITESLSFGDNTVEGYTVKIMQDTDAEPPREYDNLGTMVCWHGRYSLGDNQPPESPMEFQKTLADIEKDGGVVLSLYLYDHSGITISTGPFSCPWDSGQVGWIYATGEKIRKEFGKCGIERARKCLEGEVETYDQYLTGDVYGYVIEDAHGDDVGSCWGFYGDESVKEAVVEELLFLIEKGRKCKQEQVKAWIRNRVPLKARV